jgi:hypothetical protein
MPDIHFVPEKDLEVIKKYMTAEGVVLIPEHLKEICNEEHIDKMTGEYDFGGQADIWLEVITKPDHYFFTFQE